jgi:type IV pilus assembly protein PilY1
VNSGSVSSDTKIYQARFNSGTWSGELLAYPVKADGTLGTLAWDAGAKLPTADSRKIVTVNSDGTRVPFRWGDLDEPRRQAIQPNYASTTALTTLAGQRFDFLRGDRTNERSSSNASGIFRERSSALGDIVSSSPLFVGAPYFSFPDALEAKPYSAFRATHASRKPVVYAGSNDGMLHAFDGDAGDELLAFVPSASYRNLATLSSLSYSHRFFVDGAPNMRDVYYNGDWHTVLVGGLNSGGQEVYALDITDPKDFAEANAASLVKWEFTDRDGPTAGVTGDKDLGSTYSQPAVVRLHTGRWAAIFGNGYNNTVADGSQSTTGNAVLYIVDIEDGTLIRRIDTLTGTTSDPNGASRPNGLATPAAVDADGDRIVDFVYAGDLFGNMWKFDIQDADSTKWGIPYGSATVPEPLFKALGSTDATKPNTVTRAQPITARPEIVRGPKGVGMVVLFGTGKYLETTDDEVNIATPELQSYYGIWDQNSGTAADQVSSRSLLLEQKIIQEGPVTFGANTQTVRVTSANKRTTQRGWYLDLIFGTNYKGERQVSNTVVRGSRVIFTTLIPTSDPCSFGGSSWLMELQAVDGSRLDIAPFDLDGRQGFDAGDMVEIVVAGVKIKVPVSGLQPDVGITPEPGILYGDGAAQEYLYSPGTTGDIRMTIGSTDPRARGRQSWRQVR